INATLDRMAVPANVCLRERQRRASRDHELFAHEIAFRNQFRHWMLNLQARVHLEKIEIACRISEQKLNRPRAGVVHRTSDLHGSSAHALTEFGIVYRRRTFFDHFLMAALNGTLALAEMDHVAVRVAEDLYLDVPRTFNRFFEIERRVAKSSC